MNTLLLVAIGVARVLVLGFASSCSLGVALLARSSARRLPFSVLSLLRVSVHNFWLNIVEAARTQKEIGRPEVPKLSRFSTRG